MKRKRSGAERQGRGRQGIRNILARPQSGILPATGLIESMDIARPDVKRRRQRRRIFLALLGVALLAVVTVGLSRLEPAAPSVERGSLIIDTVKRGEMLRQVRGNGTLVPEELLFVQAESDGRVERVLVLPGAAVRADTVLMELSNPDLEQEAFNLEWEVKAAEATLRRLKVQLESDRLTQAATVERLKTDLVQAKLEAEANAALALHGLVPELTSKRFLATADQLEKQLQAEERRLAISADSTEAQLAVQKADIERIRASLALKQRKVAALRVAAGVNGVLQQIGDRETLQVGQRVTPGLTLAKIVQPNRLKAEIKIAETQARDIELGQKALIDTRNGVVPGEVVRIDPASIQGTVTIDVKLQGELPRGARPDLSVDGTIELERMTSVLYVGRPINSQSESTVSIYKLVNGGLEATRSPVKFGRSSVSTIVVAEGLMEGDQVITSDMGQWDAHEKVRLR
jgi:HlyD family secretion protein